MQLQVTYETAEDGWIVVKCPALPGCISQGRTQEEAKTNIKEAIELWLETANDMAMEKEANNLNLQLGNIVV